MIPRDDRKFQVLAAVVRLYSETGQPVSSALVARWLDGSVSSATVRADMMHLEDKGMLGKPHTSAGRVPTDKGFRSFVNRILEGQDELSPRPEIMPMVEQELRRSSGTHTMVKSLASLLSRLTDNIGIILGPAWDGTKAQRLELYAKDGGRILMVLILENALVRTGTIVVDEPFSAEILEDAARLLSERVNGLTIREIRDGALDDLSATGDAVERCASDLAERGSDLFLDVEDGELELMGVTNMLDAPEFSDPDRLKNLVRFLESPRSIRGALRQLSPENEDGIAVWIGAENPIDALQGFSLVSSPCEMEGRRGMLAVLGLRRMPYDRAISGMQVLIQSLKQRD